jgi:carbon-monoxide dehydrogenase small subunit
VTEDLHDISLTVNGTPVAARAPARRLLSDFLRHDLGLTGTHVGCEHGVCGACTVLIDGEPARSCLTFAVTVRDREITTVEGLAAEDGTLHPVQRAFRENHALQCGFCTPGFVMSVCGFLAEHPEPDEEEIAEGISGNLCRCTGYQNIRRAVQQAAGELRATGIPACDRAPAAEVQP